MSDNIISATFEDRASAELAVTNLRRAGVPDEAIATLSRHSDMQSGDLDTDDHNSADNKGTGMLKGLGVGAGVGAMFGLGALLVPGVGPFIAAGSLIESLGVLGSAAASGAIVGGTAGGLAGALMNYGVDEAEAHGYEEDIRAGRIWVGVKASRTTADRSTIRSILREGGNGSMRTRERTVTA